MCPCCLPDLETLHVRYAREDTHYLLYLYDLLKVELASLRSDADNDVDDPLLQVHCLFILSSFVVVDL